MATMQMTVRMMRQLLEQLGKGHDNKHIVILMNKRSIVGDTIKLDASDLAIQGDRILIGSD